jgi:imidazole glycerol-phosphate synthase subunit HisH
LKSLQGSKAKIVVLDYHTGNLNSVRRVFERLGVDVVISSSPSDVESADKIVMPGVGHFDTAMKSLEELDLIDALNHAVLVRRRPILGICLGMEVMARRSEEGMKDGLGWIEGRMIRFQILDQSHFKVPHMGWNTLSKRCASQLLDGVDSDAEFYFAHGYHLALEDPSDMRAETEYESAFTSAIERGNIFGVQFHPEKSHDAGMRILRNFVDLS